MKDYTLFVYDYAWHWYKQYKSEKKCRKAFKKSGYANGRIAKNGTIIAFLMFLLSFNVYAELWHQDNNLKIAGGSPIDWETRLNNPEKMANALTKIDTYFLRLSTAKRVSESSLRRLARLLKSYNIKTAIDTGTATWAGCRINRDFSGEISVIKKLQGYGFDIKYIALQSALSKPYKARDNKCNEYRNLLTMMPRYLDVLEYYKQVQPKFPNVSIGIVDATPAKTGTHNPDVIYRTIESGLRVRGYKLGFLLYDVPMTFNVPLNKVPNTPIGIVISKGQGTLKDKVLGFIRHIGKFDIYVNADWHDTPKYSAPDTDVTTSMGTTVLIHDLIEVMK